MSRLTLTNEPHEGFGDDGLTLAEMVVALGIIMVVLIASLSAFITVQHSQQTAEGTDRAIQLANDRIERIRQNDWPLVGFAQSVYDSALSAAGPTIKTDYDTNYLRFDGTLEDSVLFDASTPGVTNLNQVTPYEVTTEARNRFSVYTTITWGRGTIDGITLPLETATTAGADYYTFKRVRVTVTWRSGGNGQLHRVVNETWLAPKGFHEAPPGIPVENETTP